MAPSTHPLRMRGPGFLKCPVRHVGRPHVCAGPTHDDREKGRTSLPATSSTPQTNKRPPEKSVRPAYMRWLQDARLYGPVARQGVPGTRSSPGLMSRDEILSRNIPSAPRL